MYTVEAKGSLVFKNFSSHQKTTAGFILITYYPTEVSEETLRNLLFQVKWKRGFYSLNF